VETLEEGTVDRAAVYPRRGWKQPCVVALPHWLSPTITPTVMSGPPSKTRCSLAHWSSLRTRFK
jgi:hypothetical protein